MISDSNCTYDYSTGMYVDIHGGILINGNLYFFDSTGRMLHDCYIVYGNTMKTGWIGSDGLLTGEQY